MVEMTREKADTQWNKTMPKNGGVSQNSLEGKKITLYHGTIYKFDVIDVSNGKPFKDFGAGFYLSPSKKHSINLAQRNRQIELIKISRRKKKTPVNAWVYEYEFDSSHLNNLNIKNFPYANAEWIRFVVTNRNNREPQHSYDIVIGPTANDTMRTSIQAFFAGAYGNINSDEAVNILIRMMEPKKFPVQYLFSSQKAADLLLLKNRAIIE